MANFKKGFLFSFLLLLPVLVFAQTGLINQDSLLIDIKLKDGSMAKGRVVEQLDGPRAIFKTTTGKLYVISKDNTEDFEIDREKLQELIRIENETNNQESDLGSLLFTNPYWGFGFRYRTLSSGPVVLNTYNEYGDRIQFYIQEISSTKFSFEYLVGSDFPVSGFVYFDYASYHNKDKGSRNQFSVLDNKPDSVFSENKDGFKSEYSTSVFTIGGGLRYQTQVKLGEGFAKPGIAIFAGKKTATYKTEYSSYPVNPNPNYGSSDNYEEAASELNSPWQVGVELSAEYFFTKGLSLVTGYQLIKSWSGTTYKSLNWQKNDYYDSQTGNWNSGKRYLNVEEKVSFVNWTSQTHIGLNFYF